MTSHSRVRRAARLHAHTHNTAAQAARVLSEDCCTLCVSLVAISQSISIVAAIAEAKEVSIAVFAKRHG